MTIDGSATQLVTALTAGMPQVASNAAVDTYSDTVTVVASY